MRDIAPKKKTPSAKSIARRSKKPAAEARRAATGFTDALDRYGLPGAAALASGAAIAAGIALHDPLERMAGAALRSLVSTGTSAREVVARNLDLRELLAHVGLRRRRSPVAIGLGVLGGVAAVSALAYWLAPRVQGAFAEQTSMPFPSQPPRPREPAYSGPIDATT